MSLIVREEGEGYKIFFTEKDIAKLHCSIYDDDDFYKRHPEKRWPQIETRLRHHLIACRAFAAYRVEILFPHEITIWVLLPATEEDWEKIKGALQKFLYFIPH